MAKTPKPNAKAPSSASLPDLQVSIRRHLAVGVSAIAILFGCVGAWAATTEFSGAVIASGVLVVDSSDKKVQHPTGGVVAELLVRDGDRVEAGQVMLRLDDTLTRANLGIVTKGIDELTARIARLTAERDGDPGLDFPPELTSREDIAAVHQVMTSESRLFQLRADARAGLKAQLSQRVGQLQEEIGGLTNQIAAKAREVELIGGELESVLALYNKNLAPLDRMNQLKREAARLEGERGSLIAAVAQAKGKITETELQILQIDQDMRSDVAKDMREAQGKLAELVERRAAAEDQLRRTDLRAPGSGIVHQLAAHTVGGVINASDPVMVIVPDTDRLTVEAKIAPQDIDSVRVGQPASLRLSAFDQRSTPEVDGSVKRVSPDLTVDPRTGIGYYTARVEISPKALATIKDLRLVPGMPVETFIQTPPRTVISYLTKPFANQFRKAFREK